MFEMLKSAWKRLTWVFRKPTIERVSQSIQLTYNGTVVAVIQSINMTEIPVRHVPLPGRELYWNAYIDRMLLPAEMVELFDNGPDAQRKFDVVVDGDICARNLHFLQSQNTFLVTSGGIAIFEGVRFATEFTPTGALNPHATARSA